MRKLGEDDLPVIQASKVGEDIDAMATSTF
jgi:hypothetical protein